MRFQETSETQALAPRIMGKTGLIGGVRTLSGIVKTNSNKELYYSIMVNDFRAPAEDVMTFIDKTALFLAKLD